MKAESIWILVAIVAVYLYWHANGTTAYARQMQYNGLGTSSGTNIKRGGTGSWSPSSVSSSASTAPSWRRRELPVTSSPWANMGVGRVAAPVFAGRGTRSSQRYIGAPSLAGTRRSTTGMGFGTGSIAPSSPTTQVTSTRNIRIGSGQVQIPSWAAIPATVRGPGGQGSILNLN